MWTPTHVHVIVHSADSLLVKGKNNTNNAFVVIELGKETYRTSVKEKVGKTVLWNEECELKIPKTGNTANLILTAYHRNSLSLDQFLGTVKIPLISFDKDQRIVEWYKLEGKPGKEKGKNKFRGELEVEIGFISKSKSQSLTSLQSKGKKSIERLTGSLFGLGSSDKKVGVKKFANTLSRAVLNKKKKESVIVEHFENNENGNTRSYKNYNNLDPGVISDDEEGSSHKSSESLTTLSDNPNMTSTPSTPPPKPRKRFTKNPQISVSNWEDDNKLKLNNSSLNVSQDSMSSTSSRRYSPKLENSRKLNNNRRSSSCVDFSLLSSPKPQKKFSSSFNLEKNHGETHKKLSKFAKKLRSLHSLHSLHSLDKKEMRSIDSDLNEEDGCLVAKTEFKNKNKEELINMIVALQKKVSCVSLRVQDLEDYLDGILVKVMDTVPKILEKS